MFTHTTALTHASHPSPSTSYCNKHHSQSISDACAFAAFNLSRLVFFLAMGFVTSHYNTFNLRDFTNLLDTILHGTLSLRTHNLDFVIQQQFRQLAFCMELWGSQERYCEWLFFQKKTKLGTKQQTRSKMAHSGGKFNPTSYYTGKEYIATR
jgi:hypothetical protein